LHPYFFASASDDHTVWIWGLPQEQSKSKGLLATGVAPCSLSAGHDM
jgi:hypothetical protein